MFNTIADDVPASNLIEPFIVANAAGVSTETSLSWTPALYATAYDLWLWKAGTDKPTAPAAADLTVAVYNPSSRLEYGTTYNWQVAAKNVMGAPKSAEWTFTTVSYPYLRDALLLLQTLAGIERDVQFISDINGDNQKGMPEAIWCIRKAAVIR